MLLHYQPDFHPDLTNLCKRLRCHLGGDRPSQTTHQALFPLWIRSKKMQSKKDTKRRNVFKAFHNSQVKK